MVLLHNKEYDLYINIVLCTVLHKANSKSEYCDILGQVLIPLYIHMCNSASSRLICIQELFVGVNCLFYV